MTITIKQLEGRINRLRPSRLAVLARMPDGTEREMSAPEYVEAVKTGADFIRSMRGTDLRDVSLILSTIEMHLQKPQIIETEGSVIVIIKHERLADAETLVMQYMETHKTISNTIARELTGISDANKMKRVFIRLKNKGLLGCVHISESTMRAK